MSFAPVRDRVSLDKILFLLIYLGLVILCDTFVCTLHAGVLIFVFPSSLECKDYGIFDLFLFFSIYSLAYEKLLFFDVDNLWIFVFLILVVFVFAAAKAMGRDLRVHFKVW